MKYLKLYENYKLLDEIQDQVQLLIEKKLTMQLSTENKFTSAKQFTSYITKTLKDYGFKRYEKVTGENSAMEYHKEKTFVVGTSYIVVDGIQDINEAKEIKKSFESFFKSIFGDKRNCVSKEIRKTYTKKTLIIC